MKRMLRERRLHKKVVFKDQRDPQEPEDENRGCLLCLSPLNSTKRNLPILEIQERSPIKESSLVYPLDIGKEGGRVRVLLLVKEKRGGCREGVG